MRVIVVCILVAAAGCTVSGGDDCNVDSDCTGALSCVSDLCACVVGSEGAECSSNADCRPFGAGSSCVECRCESGDGGGEDGGSDAGSDATADSGGGCVPVTETTEANDTDAEAQELGELAVGSAVCISGACTGAPGDADFFRLTTTAQSTLTGDAVECENPMDLTAVEFFDGDSNFLGGPIDSTCDAHTEIFDSVAGVYFVRIACDPNTSGTYVVRVGVQAP